ncbi:hypothetical protein [Stutzerimonas azotifigens]|uniref:hypothetical protein n=1 Tax=Stutzerimonas azotifigens TaxID=291995 RepID=UPI00126836E1|nr:hypothetical protein [Stutzerimonas azotifigens]
MLTSTVVFIEVVLQSLPTPGGRPDLHRRQAIRKNEFIIHHPVQTLVQLFGRRQKGIEENFVRSSKP